MFMSESTANSMLVITKESAHYNTTIRHRIENLSRRRQLPSAVTTLPFHGIGAALETGGRHPNVRPKFMKGQFRFSNSERPAKFWPRPPMTASN